MRLHQITAKRKLPTRSVFKSVYSLCMAIICRAFLPKCLVYHHWFLQSYTALDHVHVIKLQGKKAWEVWGCLGFPGLVSPILASNTHFVPVNQQVKLVEKQKYALFCICRTQRANTGVCITGPTLIMICWCNRIHSEGKSCFSDEER